MRWAATGVFLVAAVTAEGAELSALVYHDVVDSRGGDEYALTKSEFEAHLSWLAKNQYRVVSAAQVIAAKSGVSRLPEKAVLITFDDGLRSFRDTALPILRKYGFPAVVTVVSRWVDGAGVPDAYHGRIMTWSELKDIARDPLVEVGSHTHDLHREVPSDPFGNVGPAGRVRAFLKQDNLPETEIQFRERIRRDLKQSADRIATELGKKPTVLAWPYGEYDGAGAEVAEQLNFRMQLTLDDRQNLLGTSPRVHRAIMRGAHGVAALKEALGGSRTPQHPIRFLHVGIDQLSTSRGELDEDKTRQFRTQVDLLKFNTIILSYPPALRRSHINLAARAAGAIRQTEARRVYLDFSASKQTDIAQILEHVRQVRVQGVILPARLPDTALVEVRRQQPSVLVGVAGDETEAAWSDFRLTGGRLTPDAVTGLDRALLKPNRTPRSLFLLAGENDGKSPELKNAIRDVRRAGIRDFGVSYAMLPPAGSQSVALAVEIAGHVSEPH